MQLLRLALFSFTMFIMLFIVMSRLISKPIAQNIVLQEQKLHLLEESQHEAETKSRFISQMSHEFRTPLNFIIGFSQFLSQKKLLEKEYEKSGKNLLSMVNQILEFAKSKSVHLVIGDH